MTPPRDLIDSLELFEARPGSVASTDHRVALASTLDALFASGEMVTLGRFEVKRRIGSGANGTVFEAWDPKLDRAVAIKVLHRRADRAGQARMLAEAQGLAKVKHPGVLTIHEVGEEQGRLFLVMELMTGGSLREWLKVSRTPEEIAAALLEPVQGLAEAHAMGMVHRDIKPENFVVDGRGRVKLADFGLAMSSHEGVQGFAGTPAYAAPEQLEGGDVSAASDVYALCVTLFEVLTGERPSEGATLPYGLQPELVEVVNEGLSADSTKRPAAREVAAGLALVAGGDHARTVGEVSTAIARETLADLLPRLQEMNASEREALSDGVFIDGRKEPEELRLRMFSNVFTWIQDVHGEAELARILALSGIHLEDVYSTSTCTARVLGFRCDRRTCSLTRRGRSRGATKPSLKPVAIGSRLPTALCATLSSPRASRWFGVLPSGTSTT